MKPDVSNRDWFGKVSAGLVCGYLLALGAGGLFKHAAGAGKALYGVHGIVSVQLFAILWTLAVCFCFLFRSTLRAWTWLGIATVLLWGVLIFLGVTA